MNSNNCNENVKYMTFPSSKFLKPYHGSVFSTEIIQTQFEKMFVTPSQNLYKNSFNSYHKLSTIREVEDILEKYDSNVTNDRVSNWIEKEIALHDFQHCINNFYQENTKDIVKNLSISVPSKRTHEEMDLDEYIPTEVFDEEYDFVNFLCAKKFETLGE
jgi:hypothetical protein